MFIIVHFVVVYSDHGRHAEYNHDNKQKSIKTDSLCTLSKLNQSTENKADGLTDHEDSC